MGFTSVTFYAFLAFSVIIYYLIPQKVQWMWLLAISTVFYLAASPKFALFLLFSIVTTYAAGQLIGGLNRKAASWSKPSDGRKRRTKREPPPGLQKKKRAVLVVTLLFNLGVLLTLKYSNFFLGLFRPDTPELKLILPLGISFYTLQVIGYCIDVYRGKYEPENNLAKYALFVSFFPQIVQGPIARFDHLAGQFIRPHRFDFVRVRSGFQLLLWGLFKKMVVADRVNILVNQVFNNFIDYGGFQIYIACLFYTMQLYADFSGYVDIARGAAEMFGIELAQNFNHPYFAQSIQDFWRRWHISLSSWFRDYLYIPLGGNRKGKVCKYINVLVVFVVSGFWHGAGLNFLVWGLLHGLYQVVGTLLTPVGDWLAEKFETDRTSFSHRMCKGVITFQLVNFAWIFFRAETLDQAACMIRYMFTVYNPWVFFDGSLYKLGLDMKDFRLAVFGFVLILIVSLLQEKMHLRERLAKQSTSFQFFMTSAAIFSILLFGIYGPGYNAANFIYANF